MIAGCSDVPNTLFDAAPQQNSTSDVTYTLDQRYSSNSTRLVVKFDNPLPTEALLTSVVPSCDCLSVSQAKEIFGPGEEKLISIDVDTRKLLTSDGSVDLLPTFNGEHLGRPITVFYTRKIEPLKFKPSVLHIPEGESAILFIEAHGVVDNVSVVNLQALNPLDVSLEKVSRSEWRAQIAFAKSDTSPTPTILQFQSEAEESGERMVSSVSVFERVQPAKTIGPMRIDAAPGALSTQAIPISQNVTEIEAVTIIDNSLADFMEISDVSWETPQQIALTFKVHVPEKPYHRKMGRLTLQVHCDGSPERYECPVVIECLTSSQLFSSEGMQ